MLSTVCAEAQTSELALEKTEVRLVHESMKPLKLFAGTYLCIFWGEKFFVLAQFLKKCVNPPKDNKSLA